MCAGESYQRARLWRQSGRRRHCHWRSFTYRLATLLAEALARRQSRSTMRAGLRHRQGYLHRFGHHNWFGQGWGSHSGRGLPAPATEAFTFRYFSSALCAIFACHISSPGFRTRRRKCCPHRGSGRTLRTCAELERAVPQPELAEEA